MEPLPSLGDDFALTRGLLPVFDELPHLGRIYAKLSSTGQKFLILCLLVVELYPVLGCYALLALQFGSDQLCLLLAEVQDIDHTLDAGCLLAEGALPLFLFPVPL